MAEEEKIIHKISKKIVGQRVITEEDRIAEQQEELPILEVMHESIKRSTKLYGATYKIKMQSGDPALYITINDHILNAGTKYEQIVPYEIFINSKNMEHFQWIVALTRLISAVFRKGGNSSFIVGELEQVFDPKGGYWKGGRFVSSIVAEIGMVIKEHFISIGLIKPEELTDDVKEILAEKRAQFEATQDMAKDAKEEGGAYPDNARMCKLCSHKAVIRLDNCDTCLHCADSKCG